MVPADVEAPNRAQPPNPRTIGVAVAGADHPHLFQIVDRLVQAGAETVAHTGDGALVEGYEAWRS